jgi:hypothetical protein
MNDDPSDATVQAAPGQMLNQVAAASSYKFDFTRLQDDDMTLVSQPVRFRYTGAHGFVLSPTRFLGLSSTVAIVIMIDVAPQLAYVDLSEALALLDQITTAARLSGWQDMPGEPGLVGREELAMLAADPGGPEQATWHVAQFRAGTERLLLRLRRLHRARPGGTEQYLLNLQWRDEALADRARQIGRTLRQEDGQRVDIWRPINLGSYAPRVAEMMQAGR